MLNIKREFNIIGLLAPSLFNLRLHYLFKDVYMK